MYRIIKEREEREKQEALDLLRTQMTVEGELVKLYERTEGEMKSSAVGHLLHMIQLDSRKHIDICQTVIEVLQGEEVLTQEKKELIEGLQRHVDLEKGSIERANKILKNVWIRETKGLEQLIKRLRDDEREHHKTLKKLTGRAFFREDPFEFGMFRDKEARYERRIKRRKQE